MSKLAETLDEAVARIMKESCSFGGFPTKDGVRVVHSTNVDFEAAIRQGIAWALEDAAKTLWHGPGCPEFSGRAGKRYDDRRYAVSELRRKAEEASRG